MYFPEIRPQLHDVVIFRSSKRKHAGWTDPEHTMTPSGEFRRDLLRSLKSEIKIDDSKNDHVVLSLWRYAVRIFEWLGFLAVIDFIGAQYSQWLIELRGYIWRNIRERQII